MRGVKAIYGLSPQGASLIGEASPALIPWKPNRVITTSSFLAHQQAVNEIFIQARFHPLPPQVSCERWLTFREPLSPSLPLIPDGYLEIGNSATVHKMFLEVDLGTETSKVWKGKVELYLKFAVGGEFERMFHEKRFRVLVLLHSSRRLEIVRKTIASRTDKLFWLSTHDQVRGEGLFGPVWLRPKGEERMSLL
jgi:Replication-relaxation